MNVITLYHGTTHNFSKIDVSRGKAYKDFGIGFYATADISHARNLALRNLRIEQERWIKIGGEKNLSAYVYTYEFNMKFSDMLNCKKFGRANREWLEFIILNRTSGGQEHNFDLVIGPTANDNTRTSIRMVTNAANGNILSDTALNLLITLLEPENLPTQYYFGTEKAAKLLDCKGKDVIM
jgi:hypothetical protein